MQGMTTGHSPVECSYALQDLCHTLSEGKVEAA